MEDTDIKVRGEYKSGCVLDSTLLLRKMYRSYLFFAYTEGEKQKKFSI